MRRCRGPAFWALSVGCLASISASMALTEPVFVERTAETGLDFVHFNGMSGELYFIEMVGAGTALVDYDGDGDLDLFAVQGSLLGADTVLEDATFQPVHPLPLTDRLYRNDRAAGEGATKLRFVDVTERATVDAPGYGMGVTAADFDNDGWVDLYVTNVGPNQLLRNRGDGTFVSADLAGPAGRATDWSVSSTAVDFDRDGWLDLYAANYVDFRMATHKQCKSDVGTDDYCGPLAYPPLEDTLYRNRGDGGLEDVTAAAGLAGSPASTLGVVAADFDSNGWLDLYAANDQVPNHLWINQGDGTFIDDAVLAGAAVNAEGRPEASMGVVAADFDGDGSEDLMVTHLVRETNTLYLNDGGGFFHDATQGSGLGRPSFRSTGFGVAILDYDGDGWLDLYVANGAVRRVEEQYRAGEAHPLRQANHLYRNRGGGAFVEEPAGVALAGDPLEVSRGVAAGDVDNDGDPDLVVTHNAGPTRLLLNESAPSGWLGVRTHLGAARRDALGAQVTVTVGDRTMVRRVRTDGSYLSSGDPRIQVGLGVGQTPAAVTVAWPGGDKTRLAKPPVAHYLVFRSREGATR